MARVFFEDALSTAHEDCNFQCVQLFAVIAYFTSFVRYTLRQTSSEFL